MSETKVCLGCKQKLPVDLFRAVMVKGVQKRVPRCKSCMDIYNKAYYQKNRERMRARMEAYGREWLKRNPEKVLKYRAISKERAREYMRELYWKNPEAARLKVRQYKERYRENVKINKRRWLDENPERVRAYCNEQTAKLTDAYVRSKLATDHKKRRTLSATEIPQELVELKRIQILIKRKLKNETHT